MAEITSVVIPSLTLQVEGDLALPPRFEWVSGKTVKVQPGAASFSTALRVHNDNDVPMRFPVVSVRASNQMVANVELVLAEVAPNSFSEFTVTITLASEKQHGDVVTISFDPMTVTTVESTTNDGVG